MHKHLSRKTPSSAAAILLQLPGVVLKKAQIVPLPRSVLIGAQLQHQKQQEDYY
jgi:hypothetical protein